MLVKEKALQFQQVTGVNVLNNNENKIPESNEELEIHMQLNYKQSMEIAQEEVLSNVLAFNKYDLINKRTVEDIVTIGIGAVKTTF